MNRGIRTLTFLLFFIVSADVFCSARLCAFNDDTPSDNRYSFAIIFENDYFADTDKGYTNGFFAAVAMPWQNEQAENWNAVKRHDFIFKLTDRLTLVDDKNRECRKSFAIGQSIVTPDEIEKDIPPEDDLPYAGFLTGKMTIQYQNDSTSDSMGLLVGVVGPSSQAEKVQKTSHKIIGVTKPKGWHYQLKDEFLLNVSYVHKWKLVDTLTSASGFYPGWDTTVYAGADAGNVLSDVTVGGIVRIGNGANKYPSSPYRGGIGFIPDIGYSRNFPFVINLIGGVEASYVFQSIILDGNTFSEGPDVDRVPLCANLFGGVGLGFKGLWFSFVMVRGTKIFEEQEEPFKYGSVTLGCTF